MDPVSDERLSFEGDKLMREHVAKRIVKLIVALSEAENLPAGRVLAVDSPWGSGKSWRSWRGKRTHTAKLLRSD